MKWPLSAKVGIPVGAITEELSGGGSMQSAHCNRGSRVLLPGAQVTMGPNAPLRWQDGAQRAALRGT